MIKLCIRLIFPENVIRKSTINQNSIWFNYFKHLRYTFIKHGS